MKEYTLLQRELIVIASSLRSNYFLQYAGSDMIIDDINNVILNERKSIQETINEKGIARYENDNLVFVENDIQVIKEIC